MGTSADAASAATTPEAASVAIGLFSIKEAISH
jgi:hypothetical protein